jgi:hypothetical protein
MPHQGHELQQTSTKKITASPPQAIKMMEMNNNM